MPIQCAKCRSWNRDGDAYCSFCRAPLTPVSPAPAPVPSSPAPAGTGRRRAMARPIELSSVRGEVQSLQNRAEGPITVCTFLVQAYDSSGNPLPPVPVEMRGAQLRGVLSAGHEVQIDSRWREGETLSVRKMRNLTTGAEVSAATPGAWIGKLFLALVLLCIVAAVIAALVLRSG